MLHQATRETGADQFFYALLEIDRDKRILITIPDMHWTTKHFWHISDLEAPTMRNKIEIMTKPKVLLLGEAVSVYAICSLTLRSACYKDTGFHVSSGVSGKSTNRCNFFLGVKCFNTQRAFE
jgi:hypothetical protein